MDRTVTTLSGSSQAALNDRDIAHIARVMRASLRGDLAGPILPPPYWRTRLNRLFDAGGLSHAQLCVIDDLLLHLDQFEAPVEPAWDEFAPAAAALLAPAYTANVTQPL